MNRFAWVGLVVALGAGCGGGETQPVEETADTSGTEVVAEPVEEPEPPPPPAPGSARVIHAAAGAARAQVTASAGDAELGTAAFKSATTYTEMEGGAQVDVMVEGGEPVASEGPAAGAPGTLVVYSDAETPAGLAVLALVDEARTVTGQQRARAVNALLGADSIDVCVPGATARAPGMAVFMDVGYGTVGGIPSFPSRYQPVNFAGAVRVQVRQHAETPCSGRVIGTAALPEVDINEAHNLTLIVVGRTSGRPAVAKEMLVCQDVPGDGSCVAVPLR